jgi:hypothetical protein
MSNRFALMLASGFVVFGIGGLSRAYMYVLISQSPLVTTIDVLWFPIWATFDPRILERSQRIATYRFKK